MRIGIFGGSFNPPHKMHKRIALELIQNGYLDKVIYVPTGNKYNKKDLINIKYRLKMLKLMIQTINQLDLSNYEAKDYLKYTYQTLDYFKNKYPYDEIYFICGSDNLKDIINWKNYKYILDNYMILVIKRNDDNIDEIIEYLNSNSIVIAEVTLENISSTDIRNDLKLEKDNGYLDEKVLKYIKRKKLYRKGESL